MKIPLADLIRKLRSNKIGQGENPPLGASALEYNKAESSAMQNFARLATNGAVWRFSLSKAHYFMESCISLEILYQWLKNGVHLKNSHKLNLIYTKKFKK